jgi:transposase
MPKEVNPGRPTTRRYSQEEKDQAVRLVRQSRSEGRGHGAVQRVAVQLGYGVETVRKWVRQADVDEGVKAGRSSEDAALIRELQQRNKELERSNAILRSASAFFAAELDRPSR